MTDEAIVMALAGGDLETAFMLKAILQKIISNENEKTNITYSIKIPKNIYLDLNTIFGNIEIKNFYGEMSVKSISGSVDISLPGSHQAGFRLKTVTGEVYTDLDINFLNKKENPIVGYLLKGKTGNGGVLKELESVSNNLYVRKM